MIFDWAPFCSGPLGVGEMLATVLAEERAAAEINNKRPVIVTAFGIHDASYQLQVSQNNIKDWYRDQMPQEIFKRDGFRAAGLAACREATVRFTRAAAGVVGAAGVRTGADLASSPKEEEEEGGGREGGGEEGGKEKEEINGEGEEEEEEEGGGREGGGEEEGEGRGHGRWRRTQELRERHLPMRQKRRLAAAEAAALVDVDRGDASQRNATSDNSTDTNNDTSTSTEAEVSVPSSPLVDGAMSGGSSTPQPLVFLLQNNGYNDPDDFQQTFLNEVRRIQRQEIGIGLSAPEAAGNSTAGRELDNGNSGGCGGGGGGVSSIVDVDEEGEGDGAGVFLVDDNESLYGKLACFRIDPSSHYHEPVKIVEGKVLWDLIALADRGRGAPARSGDSDVSGADRVGAAMGLAVGIAMTTAVVVLLTSS